jgi:hypothetical protein
VSQTSLDDAMATLSAAVLEESEHPSPDELLAYQAGELSQDDHIRLQGHLAWCSECAGTIVDLASWPKIELRDPALARTASEEAEDWKAIQQRLSPTGACDEDPPPAPIPVTAPWPGASPLPTVPRSYGLIHLMAAALLIAVVGLSFQVVRLSHRPVSSRTVAAETPQANVFVVDLEPVGTAGGTRTSQAGRPNAPETSVPTGVGMVVFLLVQEDLRQFSGYAVELRGADGGIFWHSEGLVSLPEGGFSIAVPLAAIPSNEIEIRLYGIDREERELLSTYQTSIRRAPAH